MRKAWSIVLCLVLASGAVTVLGAGTAGAAAAEPLEPLGSLGEFTVVGSTPQAVNDDGFVVGRANTPSGTGFAAFLYNPDTRAMTMLPELSHSALFEGALGLNDNRDVVGFSVVAQNEEAPAVAVEWRADGQNIVLGTLQNRPCLDPASGPCDRSQAYGINNHGVVVGVTSVADATAQHAFVWTPRTATMHDLGTLPGGANSVAYGINDAGLIVGSSEVGGDPVATHAFSYDLRSGIMRDLGTLPGGASSEARAVNGPGLIAGSSSVAGGAVHPFLFDPATSAMVDLGALPMQSSNLAAALNDRGVVVGSSGGGTEAQAWIYDPLTHTLDPVKDAVTAVGINDDGMMVGEGYVHIIEGEIASQPFAAYRTNVRLRVPSAPRKLQVTTDCAAAPTLTWVPARSGPYAAAVGYVVYRNSVPIALTGDQNFTDPHPLPFATYRVAAGNVLGLGPLSSRVSWPCPAASAVAAPGG